LNQWPFYLCGSLFVLLGVFYWWQMRKALKREDERELFDDSCDTHLRIKCEKGKFKK
jgi:hypothetical protein